MVRTRGTYVLAVAVVVGTVFGGCGKSSDDEYSGPVYEQSAPTGGTVLRYETSEEEPLDRFAAGASEGQGPGQGGDKYAQIVEQDFTSVGDMPRSTFSIDVDTASYAKTRMYLLQQQVLPPVDAVRIEEFINYFQYEYSTPTGADPFAVNVEVAQAPWAPRHQLARIGIKGRELEHRRPTSNLVFLLDVSGSMDYPNKLPLVKQGMRMLVSQLDENDCVAVVVYAGAAGVVLPATPGDDRRRIYESLERLHAGGSTNGGDGIRLAYQIARANYVHGGTNRVLLCTDGDFNVGTTSSGDLIRLVSDEAKSGVFLSVLGFGMGNHNDAMLEKVSNQANGNYAFIDSLQEARKVLLDQIDSTLVTIAKDVKIQVEFNPSRIAAYRLIGYENRKLNTRDFRDDTKDAGDIGAGHTVTALYELIPVGSGEEIGVEPLKYQTTGEPSAAGFRHEMLTVQLRYKPPTEAKSRLVVVPVRSDPVPFSRATRDFQFASAVAAFGMLLRESPHAGDASFGTVAEIASAAGGWDPQGYRAEFLQMVLAAKRLSGDNSPPAVSVVPTPVYQPPNVVPARHRWNAPRYVAPTPHGASGHFPPFVFVYGMICVSLAVGAVLGVLIWCSLAPRRQMTRLLDKGAIK